MAGAVLRPRLFRKLDRSRRRSVLWIVAPAGAGKTTLVASWLRARRFPHVWIQLDEGDADVASFFHHLAMALGTKGARRARLPVFTQAFLAAPENFSRLFFRAAFARSSAPRILVLDDYQMVRMGSPLHAALHAGFQELPEGVTAVVLSRREPPQLLNRLEVGGSLEIIQGEQLALTESEAFAVARLWGHDRTARETVRQVHRLTQGWATGLVLFLRGRASIHDRTQLANPDEALFAYLAREILEDFDAPTRQVLLETALFSRFSPQQAARLTAVETAPEILERLRHRGCFITRQGDDYQYHELFRSFLLTHAERWLTSEHRARVRLFMARMQEEGGQPDDAISLYVLAGAWSEAGRLIRARAPALLRQGRAATVAGWVLALPEEIREADPWLLLALGQALVFQDAASALRHLEAAFHGFRVAEDGQGLWLSWAAVVEMNFVLFAWNTVDRWISMFDELRVAYPGLGGPGVEARVIGVAFGALGQRKPWYDGLASLGERAMLLALTPGCDANSRLSVGQHLLYHYGGCVNDLGKARVLVEALRPLVLEGETDPATTVSWHLCDAVHSVFLARAGAALDALEHGRTVAEQSGFHQMDGLLLQQRIFAALQVGDLATADRELVQLHGLRFSGAPLDSLAFHHCAVLVARWHGDGDTAGEHARICRSLIGTLSSYQAEMLLGISCALAASPESLEAELEQTLALARRCGNRYVQASSLLGLALVAMRRGEDERGLQHLREGLASGRNVGCLYFASLLPDELAECCAAGLERGVESDYVCALIRAQHLEPSERARELDVWPWESRISALGQFAVFKRGELLRAGRKEQKKPLEMLRVLVATGERGLQQDVLAEALWPDADGDRAHHALSTTVYRLRRLLDCNELVIQQGGRVALNPRRVFVDAWALERSLDHLDTPRDRRDGSWLEPSLARARSLYVGELLPGNEEPLVASARERLAQRMRRHLPSGTA